MNDSIYENLVRASISNGLYRDLEGKLRKVVSLSGPGALVLEIADDEMEILVECPSCKKATKVGQLRMISGVVGCDNAIAPGKSCYFDEVLPRVLKEKESEGRII